ncbi:MAG: hypothetical protein KKF26_03720 [Chloroflexi bacterium]|nr:hypothetical protein [Chloroflexota bacterium]
MVNKTIEMVLKEHRDRLMAVPGIIGIALGEYKGKPCINVYLVQKNYELLQHIPPTLGGYHVVAIETGELQALDTQVPEDEKDMPRK